MYEAIAGQKVTHLCGAPIVMSTLLNAVETDKKPLPHTVEFVTALFFDLGVYLIVVGLVLDVLRSLGARVDVDMAQAVSR